MGIDCIDLRKLKHLRDLSLFVDDLINLRSDMRAPYVGQSAFSHKGGAHVNAVQKNPETFEHIRPETVGNERHILVSELSGGSSILLKAQEVCGGIRLEGGNRRDPEGTQGPGAQGLRLRIRRCLVPHPGAEGAQEAQAVLRAGGFRVVVEKRGKDEPCVSEATVKVRVKDRWSIRWPKAMARSTRWTGAAQGAAPALSRDRQRAVGRFPGADPRPAGGHGGHHAVQIESGDGKQTWGTVGVSENIIEASWEALVDSVEYKLFIEEEGQAKGTKKPRAGAKYRASVAPGRCRHIREVTADRPVPRESGPSGQGCRHDAGARRPADWECRF
jgi:2-isopropylmalate synthase